jgi:hypothetical protein
MSQEPTYIDDVRTVLRDEAEGFRLPSLTELATTVLAVVTVVIGMGAAILWIRAGNAGLPQSTALSVIPQQEFVVIGTRELALPALVTTALGFATYTLGSTSGVRRARTGPPPRWLTPQVVGTAFWTGAIGIMIGASFDWTTLVFAATWVCYGMFLLHTPEHRRVAVIVLISATSAIAFRLASEADAPVRFPNAEVVRASGTPVKGYFLASTTEGVSLGVGGRIVQIPVRQLERVAVGHPPPDNGDRPSPLIERFFNLF